MKKQLIHIRFLQAVNLPGMIFCFLWYVMIIVYRSFRGHETELYARTVRNVLFMLMPYISWAFWLSWVLYIFLKQIFS